MSPLLLSLVFALDRTPSAEALVAQVRAAYAKVRSFKDTVEIRDVLNSKKLLRRATITFSAPRTLWFVHRNLEAMRTTMILERAGQKRDVKTISSSVTRIKADDARTEGTHVQHSWPFTLYAPLLKGKDETGFDGKWASVTQETVGGHACFRLAKNEANSLSFIWIDAKTHFVVQARQKWGAKNEHDELYSFAPVAK